MVSGRRIEFTDGQLDEMVEKYQQGNSSCEIAECFGVNNKTILKRLREMGCKIRTSGTSKINFTEEQLDEMVKKYQQGASSRELAEEFGVSQGTVLNRLRERKCEIKPSGHYVKRDIPKPWNDVDAAYVFGVLIGDASIEYRYNAGKKGPPTAIKLHTPDKKFKTAFLGAVESAFGIQATEHATQENKKIGAYSTDLGRAYDRFKWRVESWRVPKPFFDASRKVRVALCQGKIDSDGTVNGNAIVVVSVYRPGLEDLQRVVKSLGYQASLCGPYEDKREKNYQNTYMLRVSNATSELVRLPRKKKKLR